MRWQPSCLSLSEKLAYCEALYRTAGLRLLFRITPFSQPTGLDDWGWPSAATSASRTPASWSARGYPVTRKSHHQKTLDSRASIQKCMLTSFGGFRGTTPAGRQAHAERLRHSPVTYHGKVLRAVSGQVLACAQIALESDLVGLYDVFTAPSVRGAGLSCQLCAHLLSEAQEQRARAAYLQVGASNQAARAVYRRRGFADGYAYHYRGLPSAGD